MELGTQIKKYRQELQISQEELADRVYVSRQTISNWENDKSYPDIHSLMLLSEIFHTSLDELIKGDIEMMKDTIQKDDVARMKRYLKVNIITMLIACVIAIPLDKWIGAWSWIPVILLLAISFVYSLELSKLQKNYNLVTFKEVLAFLDGKKFDDPAKPKTRTEKAKFRLRRIVIEVLIGLVASLGICALMIAILDLLK